MQRTIRLRFGGAAFASGNVPLTTVASKLQALQNIVSHATATVAQDRLARRGLWTNRYREVAELVFVDSHHSQLEIEAELPAPPHQSFLDDKYEGLGDSALRLVFEFGLAASRGGDLHQLVEGREERLFLLEALEAMCPATAEDYQVELFSGRRDGERLDFSADTRQRLRSLVKRERAWVYGADEESLVPGSTVEVTGRPVTDADGRLKQLDSITDVDTAAMESLRITRFEHEGRQYRLKAPLMVIIEHSEGAWIYRNEEINLWGFATCRADAIRELHEAFDYLWQSYAEEKDDVLDKKAQLLKRKLLTMVAPTRRAVGERQERRPSSPR